MFVPILICVAFGLYVCSRSKWFLSSAIGRYFFVTYYHFDVDNTAVPVKLQTARGDTLSAQESTAQFLANAQFGIVLKRLDDPHQSEFCPVALHQGALNEGSIQFPIISYANFVRQTTDSPEEANRIIAATMTNNTSSFCDASSNNTTMQRDVMKLFIERSLTALQQEPKQFTESFRRLFEYLLNDTNSCISFHVFEMEHALLLDQLLPSTCMKKYFAVHFQHPSDEPFYVALDVKDQASNASPTTSFLSVLGHTKPTSPRVVYSSFKHRTQEDIFIEHCSSHDAKQHPIHIYREDKERFDKHGKQSFGGKHGLSSFSF